MNPIVYINTLHKVLLPLCVVIFSYQLHFAQTNLTVSQTAIHKTIPVSPHKVISKADVIIGSWSCYDNQLSIKIFKEGGEYKGRIVWLKTSLDKNGLPLLDVKNPRKTDRSQPVLNMLNLYGFRYNATDKVWEDGFVYNPLTGETIKGTLELLDNNRLQMIGFVGFSLVRTTEIWTRM